MPYEHQTERTGGTEATTQGFDDSEIAAEWRFYDEGELSFALRPGLGLPTGNEDKGLSTGHTTPKLFAVMSYESDPWVFDLHFGYTRNFHNGPDERNHLYHASVVVEYNVSESVRLVSDASIESNTEQSGHSNVGSMVLGLIYTVIPNLDVDLGYRKGLTDSALDYAWLTGLALRF